MSSRWFVLVALWCVVPWVISGCASETVDGEGDASPIEEPVPDETAPTWPDGSSLSSADEGADRVTLVWTVAEDDTGVTRYHVTRDGEPLLTTAGGTSFAMIEGLDPAQEYLFSVEAEDGAGNLSQGGPSLTVVTGDEQAPVWPVDSALTASAIHPGGLTLSWTASTDDVSVASYVLSLDGQELAVVSGDITTYDVEGLAPWTSYVFHLEAEDGAGNQSKDGPSVEVKTTDEESPVWPDDIQLTAVDVTSLSVVLLWSPASDDVGVTGYEILQDDAQIALLDGSAGSFFVDGLSPWSEYTFQVEAVDGAGNLSVAGPSVTVTTLDVVAPSWPEDKSLTVADVSATSVGLTWSPAGDDVAVTGYRVFQDGVELTVLEDGSTTLEVTALSPWTDYSFRVEAEDAAGNLSGDGPEVSVKTTDEEAPSWSDDTILALVEATPEAVSLAWGAAGDDVAVTLYRVYQDEVEVAVVGDGSTAATVTGLSPWTDYAFRVEAQDAAENLSSTGPTLSVKTPDQSNPTWAAAILTVADITSDGLNLQWDGATDDVAVVLYRVYQDGVEVSAVSDGGTSFAVAGLSAGTEYSFHVEAEDAAGNLSSGGPQAVATTLDDLKPTWPGDASLSAVSVAPEEVALTWSSATDNVGVTLYRVYQDEQEVAVIDDGSVTADVAGLSPGTDYVFRVEAEDATGNLSEGGPTLQVQTTDESAPIWDAQATLTTSDVTSSGLTLQWTAATDDVGVASYLVYQDGAEVGAVDGSATTFDVSGLSPWTDYVFRVEAVDAAGNLSGGGPETAVMTLDEQAPTWPEGAMVTAWDVGATSLLLWWGEAMDDVGVTGYRIYQDGEEIAVIGPETTAWPVMGLSPWTAYVFRVEAEDAAGNLSADGPENTIQTGDEEAPTWPEDAAVATSEVTPEALVVTWPAATDDVGVAGYRVFLDGEQIAELASDQLEATIADLAPWTEYMVRVEAEDAAGNLSTTGPMAILRTADEVEPTWPLGSSVMVGDVTGNSIAVNWTPAVDDVGVASYQVSAGDAATVTVGGGTLGAQLTGLLSGATYTISVEALDGAGNLSTGGPTAVVTTPDVETPAWPGGSALVLEVAESTTIEFSWNESSDNVGIAGYVVYRDGEVIHTTDGETLKYKDWGLEASTAYDYAVEAVDAAGLVSTTGPEETFETLGLPTPPDPADVAPERDQTVVGTHADGVRFLFEGEDPIQVGVVPGAINDDRIAVIHGRVETAEGDPIPLVEITVDGHPEFGMTLSRDDGEYDMAVNGGGEFLIRFKKGGVLPTQRLVETPLRDWARVEDAVMIPLDDKVTVIDLFASDEIQVAQGTEVTDEDGARTATVMVPAGTGAEMVLPDGTTVPLTTISVRATEYTVGDAGFNAMPADLPPTSAYTYAVELSIDEALEAEALEVQFDQPVAFYLDNFLGLPVGVPVPTGYLDRQLGAWIPSLNGAVVKVLDTTGGIASLDMVGDGEPASPADLALAGVTDEELAKVAELYEEGDTLWRVLMDHFTPWDCNFPYIPPNDAEKPNVTPEDAGNDPEKDEDCEASGSVIGLTRQSLGEDVSIAGTPFTLSYRSTRTEGYQNGRAIRVPMTGDTVPASLKRIDVTLYILGTRLTGSFEPEPNLVEEFFWNGEDRYGRAVSSSVSTAKATIGYVYDGEYAAPGPSLDQGFSRIGEIPLCTGWNSDGSAPFCAQPDRTRREITLNQRLNLRVAQRGLVETRPQGFGGWSVSQQHHYSPDTGEIFLGAGGRFTGSGIGDRIDLVAGLPGLPSSDEASLGDGGPATEATLYHPADMVLAGDGSIYISDTFNHRIRRIDPDGIITTIAGSGAGGGFAGDDGDAKDAALCFPRGIDVTRDGEVYIVDAGNNRVRRVDSDGIITTVMGNNALDEDPLFGGGGCQYPLDGGLVLAIGSPVDEPGGALGPVAPPSDTGSFAEDIALPGPADVAVAADGRFYVTDGVKGLVYHVGLDGVVEVSAGTLEGSCGFDTPCGVGTHGRDMPLSVPGNLNLSREGDLTVETSDGIYTFGADGLLKRSYHPDLYNLLAQVSESGGDFFSPVNTKSIAFGPDGHLYASIGDVYLDSTLEFLALDPSLFGGFEDGLGEESEGGLFLGEGGLLGEGGGDDFFAKTEFIVRVPPDAEAYSSVGAFRIDDGFFGEGSPPDNTLFPIAGTGKQGSAGDGGFALQAELRRPVALNFAPDGSLLFLDSFNHTIRRVSASVQASSSQLGTVLIPSPDGRTYHEFVGNGQHISTRDGITGVVLLAFGYDAGGALVTVTDDQGYVTTIERDAATGQATSIIGHFGHATDLTYDANGYLASVTSPAGRTTAMAYDAGGLLTSLEDGEGFVTQFEYDSAGRLVKETDAEGGEKTLEKGFDGFSVTYTLTSPLGRQTSVALLSDGAGAVTRTTTSPTGAVLAATALADGSIVVQKPGGETVETTLAPDPVRGTRTPLPASRTTTTADGEVRTVSVERSILPPTGQNQGLFSLLQETVTVDGAQYTGAYDPSVGLFTWLTPGGSTTTTQLDALGKVVSVDDDNLSAPLELGYGDTGDLETLAFGGLETTFVYGDNGRVIEVVSPTGQSTRFSHDADDLPVAFELPSGRTYGMTRDGNGRVTSMEMPNGDTYVTTYSPNGLPIELAYPDGNVMTTEWTADGELSLVQLPSGAPTAYGYDEGGRPVSLSYDDVVVTFDWVGTTSELNGASRSDSQSDSAYAYQYTGGRISEVTLDTAVGTDSVAYEYDDRGFLDRLSVTSAEFQAISVNLERDLDGRVFQEGAYDLFTTTGSLNSSEVTDGVMESQALYDGAGRPLLRRLSVGDTPIMEITYEFNAENQVTSVIEDIDGSSTHIEYVYDADSQLLEVTRDDLVVESYTYDLNGNRLSRTLDGVEEQAVYGLGDRILNHGAVDYAVDEDGFVTSRGTHQYTYTSRGELLEVLTPDGPIAYGYDVLGRRLTRNGPDGTTRYLYGDPNNMNAVTHAVRPDGTLFALFYDNSGRVYAMENASGTEIYYVATDGIGSPRLVVDSSGDILREITYDSYGSVLADSAPEVFMPLGFAGGIADSATGLVRMGSRDYDPRSGRWMSLDPAGFDGSPLNLYVYGNNDPVGLRDPSGEVIPLLVVIAIGAGTSGAVEFGFALADGARGSDLAIRTATATALGAALAPIGAAAGVGARVASRVGATRLANALTAALVKTNAASTAVKGFIGGTVGSGVKRFFTAGSGDILGSAFLAGVTSAADGFVPSALKGALTKVAGSGAVAKAALDTAGKAAKKFAGKARESLTDSFDDIKEGASNLFNKFFGDDKSSSCDN